VKKCHHPWEGMTINPQGYIIHCCETPKRYVAHIDEVSSLTDIFNNHPSFKKFRDSIPASCLRCYAREEKGIATAKSSPALSTEWNGKIRSLEYTMSNLCNATCSMCSSYFSSSWFKYDKEDPPSSLSDSAFKKILDIVPDIEHLTIKGGEPFLDKRNLIVLKKFLEKPDGKVDIITNGSMMNEDCFDTRVHLGFSVDGTYDVYKWIRSTDWDTVINNAKRFYDETGKGVSIESCISLHNFFHVEEFYNFFIDKPYIYRINQNHFVDNPPKCSIHCLPDDILLEQRDKNLKVIEKYKDNLKVCRNNYSVMSSILPRVDTTGKYTKENAFNHIDFVNGIRGFDLLDYIPELREWRGT
tara:strand:+ start:46 stop:1113 length:1068 start_codon:yes stop_codon:yes gene_type:complete